MGITLEQINKIKRLSSINKIELLRIIGEFKPVQYRARELLFREGRTFNGCFIVQKGYAKVFKSNKLGEDSFLTISGPETFLGEFAVLNENHYPITAIAATPMNVLILSKKGYEILWQESNTFLRGFTNHLYQRFQQLNARVADLAIGDASARLIHFYAFLAENYGHHDTKSNQIHIPFCLSRKDVSDAINLKNETVSRLTSELTKKGVLIKKDNQTILNGDFMVTLANT